MCKKLLVLEGDIMRVVTLLGALVLILFAIVSAAPAEVIYYENFDGPDGPLDGTAPDIRPGGETWTAGSTVDANGAIGSMFTAGLPFTPSIGTIYELSVTVDNYGDWVAVGFVGEGFNPGARMLFNSGPVLWALVREDGSGQKDQAFVGPSTSNKVGDAPSSSAAEEKVRIETNSATEWVVSWYFDGVRAYRQTINPTALGIIDDVDYAAFGSNGWSRPVWGTVSSFMLEEITVPPEAWYPSPEDGATGVPRGTTLTWRAGLYAEKHDVYFSDDFNDVNEASRDDPRGILTQNQTTNSYPASGLVPGTTYYWRIDEVNSAPDYYIYTGDVWSFTVIPPTASNPVPTDGNIYVNPNVQVSWTEGPCADKHDVYIGTDFNAVSDANRAEHPALLYYSENQDANSYPDIGTLNLELGQTYYWRIDEVNDPNIWKGDVWHFTTMLPGAGALIGNWEQDMDGWAQVYGTTGYSSTTGVTLDSYSLKHELTPGTGYLIEIDLTTIPGGVEAFLANSNLSIDVTRLASEWSGEGSGGIALYLEATGLAWTDLGVAGNSWWSPGDGDTTVTCTWDYSSTLDAIDPNATALRVMIQQNSDGFDDSGIYYYDNARLFTPVFASNPNPANGATDVQINPTLSWTPGPYAATHDVYFSTDFNSVNDASRDNDPCGVLVSENQIANTYDLLGLLDSDTIYYWRIDEINDVCEPYLWRGEVWSFTTGNYIVVDDMEFYNDLVPSNPNSNRINYTWEDGFGHGNEQYPPRVCGNGTGSLIGHELEPIAEQTIVHGGGQSMPYYYVNDGSGENNCGDPIELYYSEAERTFDEPQDWTRKGVKALTLYFYGDPDNDINEPMWVKLRDQSDDSGKVTYGAYADEDVKNLAYPFWHEWNIALAEFGIDLNDVNSIAIGFGDEAATTQGGKGTVYFDDIQLHPPRHVPSRLKPEADLTDDCVVDYDDIVILAERWLESGLIVTPVDPVNGLVGHWKLDDGSGTTAVDSSTNNNDANLVGNTLWITVGYDDGALLFDGNDAYVELPIDSLIGSLTNSTFTTWANFSNAGGAWQRIFDFGTSETVNMFLTPNNGATGSLRFAITTDGAGAEFQATAPDTLPSGWHHVAVTIDADSNSIALYLDGLMVAQNTEATLSPSDLGEPNNNWLGRSQYAVDPNYMGLLDDFRIYSRALSTAEVAGLAGRTEAFSIPADLYEDGVIDLKDFADLGAAWLEERLWPPEP